jgi:polyphenol oxidase
VSQPAGGLDAPLTSPLLSHVAHAFSVRRGGVSSGPFASLNFGNPSDLPSADRDPPGNILRNQRLLLERLSVPITLEWTAVHQVHGGACHVVRPGRPAHAAGVDASGAPLSTRADAILTDDPSRVLAVRVADCAPILLATADGRWVAAVHAGWRGTALRIAGLAVQRLRDEAGRPSQPVLAAIGPCIGRRAFQVGSEVVAALSSAHPHLPVGEWAHPDPSAPDKWLIDLPAVLCHQLQSMGCEVCTRCAICTSSHPELFFSHRRDRGITGRMVGVIRAMV